MKEDDKRLILLLLSSSLSLLQEHENDVKRGKEKRLPRGTDGRKAMKILFFLVNFAYAFQRSSHLSTRGLKGFFRSDLFPSFSR